MSVVLQAPRRVLYLSTIEINSSLYHVKVSTKRRVMDRTREVGSTSTLRPIHPLLPPKFRLPLRFRPLSKVY